MALCSFCVLRAARSGPGHARRLGACLPCRYFMKFLKTHRQQCKNQEPPATWRVCGCVWRCSTDKNCAKPRPRLVVAVSGVSHAGGGSKRRKNSLMGAVLGLFMCPCTFLEDRAHFEQHRSWHCVVFVCSVLPEVAPDMPGGWGHACRAATS